MANQTNIFTTIRTEGALLPPDLLQRISEGETIDGLTPASYHRPGEKLNEAINRSWNALQGAWVNFRAAQERLPAGDLGTTITRDRWLLPLFRELDYGRLQTATTIEIEGRRYPISHGWEYVPIHLVSYQVDLDKRTPGVAGASSASPHSLTQIFLNRSDDHLWGFVSNGYRLRILRDNMTLTRQAYVEFDLEAMMDGEVYSDFVLLWLLAHQSRVEAPAHDGSARLTDCWLEKWMKVAEEQGTRALDQLRDGVEKAITALGLGFIEHPTNATLRDRLTDGTLNRQDYYRQLLRLVYRLLFLFVAEDRDLLLDPDAAEAVRAHYIDFYSTQRLRRMAATFKGTRHADLFEGLRLVMRLLSGQDNGAGAALALIPLGSFLFSDAAVADVIDCQISNQHLLKAIWELSMVDDTKAKVYRSVDYKHLGPEELGSIYESLLELHPQINVPARRFALATAGGNERKTTGSYYTPTSLINALLDSALDPVLAEAARQGEAAILDLNICDPACGSGHFLIAAAHRMAQRLAEVRTGEEEPSPAAVQEAKRDIIGQCIYGVDINPMAVELCKVNLWMESMEPGKPLNFLDHRILCGNSLLGTTPRLMADGIPEDVFPTKSGLLEGDENKVVSKLRKRNREERKARTTGQRSMFEIIEPPADYAGLAAEVDALDAIENDSLVGIRAKEERYRALGNDPDYIAARLMADAWCAAFVWHKAEAATFSDEQQPVPSPITDLTYRLLEENPHDTRWQALRPYVAELADQYQFFHWHVAFPDVFNVPQDLSTAENKQTGWNGGFDALLGNPPWETSDLMKVEFFATLIPAVVTARTTEDREEIIEKALSENTHLQKSWIDAVRHNEGERHFIRVSDLLPLTSIGKLNTYRSFAELSTLITGYEGFAGLVLKSGIVNAQDNNSFFSSLVNGARIVSIVDFINRKQIFSGVVANERFCFFVITGGTEYASEATFSFGLEQVSDIDYSSALRMKSRELALLNPNDLSVPPITSTHDKKLLVHIHSLIDVLVNEQTEKNPHNVIYSRGHLNSSTHSSLFSRNRYETLKSKDLIDNNNEWDQGVIRPLTEGKLMGLYNHRFGTFEGVSSKTRFGKKAQARQPSDKELRDPRFRSIPRFWLMNDDARKLIDVKGVEDRGWTLTYRHICRAIVDARTAQFCIAPTNPTSDSCALLLIDSSPEQVVNSACEILATIASFVGDYVVRQKIYGPALTKAITLQLPVIPPHTYTPALLDFIVPRVLELTYTAWDLQAFAQDVSWDGPPFVWDEERRFLMRCELDALYFHLYQIGRDDVDYIMETFPIVKRRDIKVSTVINDAGEVISEGTYRTKETILTMYDQMAALPTITVPAPKEPAQSYAVPDVAQFQTWLFPPPADPSVAHPERE